MVFLRRLPSALAAAVVTGLLVAGCDVPAGLGPETEGPPPSLNFTNGPPSPGPYIVRIPGAGSRVITTDPEKGLLAIHGSVSNLSACTDATTRVEVDIQIVRTPSDVQSMILYLTGRDNEVAIYGEGDPADLNPFDPAKFCPFIATTTPLYTGNVQYRLHINGQGNLLFQWVGFVTRTADGATFHYVEKQYAVPQGGTVQFIIEEISLQPVGG
jgi:hypothetical protein